jgi:hypothetical protein
MGERERKTENKISDKLPVRLFLTTRSHERVTALPRCLFLTQSVSSICNVHYHYYIRRVTNWTNSVSTPSNLLALCCFFTNVGWFHFVYRYDDLSRSLLSENDDVKSDNVHCNKLSRSSSLRRSSDLNSSASSTVSPKPWRRFSERFR